MNLQRILAIIERDMRKFFRSPALMVSSMIFPLMQLIVLGYAFGGKIKGVRVAVVDEDHSSASRSFSSSKRRRRRSSAAWRSQRDTLLWE